MLTKILVTIAVIVVVAMVFRNKRMPQGQAVNERAAEPESDTGVKPQTVAYAIVGLVLLVGAFLFYREYTEDHQLMEIRVTNAASGEITTYQAYRSDIKGKTFTTVDGRQVTIGDAERFEMMVR